MRCIPIILLTAISAFAQFDVRNPAYVAATRVKSSGYGTNWVTNTWTFTGAPYALFDQGNSANIGLRTDTAAGNLVAGATANNNNTAEVGLTNGANQTWNTWGVPSAGTVIAVQLVGWQGLLHYATSLTAHTNRIRVINAQSNSVTDATYLIHTNMPTATNAAFVDLATSNTACTVYASNGSASTDVRLWLWWAEKNGTSAKVTQRWDNVKIAMQYYTNSP